MTIAELEANLAKAVAAKDSAKSNWRATASSILRAERRNLDFCEQRVSDLATALTAARAARGKL